jgi:MFS family permease
LEKSSLKSLSVLMATAFVDMLGSLILVPLIPFYALRFGADAFTISLLTSAFFFAQLCAAPYWGRLSDRLGRRPVILLGQLVSAGAFLVFGLADSLWLLFLSRLVQGAAGGMTGVVQAYVSDVAPPSERAQALGWVSAATSAGVMIGPVVGSFATHFGEAAPGYLAAGLCLLNFASAWKWLAEPPRAVKGDGGEEGAPTTPRPSIWRTTLPVIERPKEPVHRLIWIYALGMLAFMGMNSILGLYLAQRFGATEQTLGWYFAYVGVLSLVLRALLLGPIVRRLGEVKTMQLGALSMCLGMFGVAGIGELGLPSPFNFLTLGLVVIFVPVGTALLFPANTSQISARAPRHEMGLTLGVQQAFGGAGRVIGPALAGLAFRFLGAPTPFWVGSTVLAMVFLLGLGLEKDAPAAKIPPS